MTRVCHQNTRECTLIIEMSNQLSLLEFTFRSFRSAEPQDTLHSPVSPSVMADCQLPQTSHSTSVSSVPASSPTCDIAQSSACQPTRIVFPSTYFSGKARSFNPAWYKQWLWLEYSVSKDAAFCYPCHMFSTSVSASTSRPRPYHHEELSYATGTVVTNSCKL